MTKYLAVALALAAAPAAAQFSSSGTPCSGASGLTPSISGTGAPAVGCSGYSIDITGPANTPGLVAVGFTILPTPIDFTPMGLPGCNLYIDTTGGIFPFFTGDNGDGTGDASFPITAPNSAGATFHLQAFVADFDLVSGIFGSLTDVLTVTTMPAPTIGAGDLVISEFMNDAGFVSDHNGEWIELYNTTSGLVNIEYYVLSDNDNDSVVLDNGGNGIFIAPGGYLVMGNDINPATNGGVSVSFEYDQTDTYMITNTADEIILTDYCGLEIDRVEYDENAGWPGGAGSAISLDVSALDATANDSMANWTLAVCPIAGIPCNPDTGTPGLQNDLCFTSPCMGGGSGELIFSEICQNPAAVSDTVGEWFEVFNTTGAPIDMMGYTLILTGCNHVISSSVVVPAGGFALFAENGDAGMNGGLPTPDYLYPTSCLLHNGTTSMQLYDTSFNLVAQVDYDDGATFPDPVGASMTLDPTMFNVTAMAMGSNWCLATSTYGLGDFGTPGAANDPCP